MLARGAVMTAEGLKPKVLIADDDRVSSQLLASRLRTKGFEVVVAFDAMQALMAGMREAPDLILLDISMPGGSGLDVLKKLKTSTKTSSIPVVVISGQTDPALPDTVKGLGAVEFLLKPVRFEDSYQIICSVLGRSE